MSQESVRDTLCRMLQHYGRSLLDDPRRCEAMLRDLCPHDKREVNLLVSALREGAAAELTSSQASVPPAAQVERLSKRLEQNVGLAEEPARWAVDSWALALGVATPESLRSHRAAQSAPPPGGVNGQAGQQQSPFRDARASAKAPPSQAAPRPAAPPPSPSAAASPPVKSQKSDSEGAVAVIVLLVLIVGAAAWFASRWAKDPNERLRVPGQDWQPYTMPEEAGVEPPAPFASPPPPDNVEITSEPEGEWIQLDEQGVRELGEMILQEVQRSLQDLESNAGNQPLPPP